MTRAKKFNNQSLIYHPSDGVAYRTNGMSEQQVKALHDTANAIKFDSVLEFKTYCHLIELFPRTSIQIHYQLPSNPFLPFDLVPDFVVTDTEDESKIKAIFEAKGYCNESYPYKLFSFLTTNSQYLDRYHIITLNPQKLLRRKIFKYLVKQGVAILALDELRKHF